MNKLLITKDLERLNNQELSNKRKDILLCIKSCRKESLQMYNEQLDAVDEIISTRNQLTINFDRPPVDDSQNND